jgi:hypothetical protein
MREAKKREICERLSPTAPVKAKICLNTGKSATRQMADADVKEIFFSAGKESAPLSKIELMYERRTATKSVAKKLTILPLSPESAEEISFKMNRGDSKSERFSALKSTPSGKSPKKSFMYSSVLLYSPIFALK